MLLPPQETPKGKAMTQVEDQAVSSPLADLDRAIEAADQIVAGIGADQWTDPTPNTEWDVRATLNHLNTGNPWLTLYAWGHPGTSRTVGT
jgi:Mycothiol maleylpyruvate isomerase N-terminal domain